MNPSQYAILWDMDGTLIDTTEMHFASWINVFKKYQLELPYSTFLKFFGKNNHAFILHFFPDADEAFIKALSDEKESEFCGIAKNNARLYPGVLQWLQYFQSKGYKQCIASSAPMMNIDVLLETTNIRPFFDYCASGANMPAKPDPALFLSVAKQVGVSVKHCLVIEDAPPGVQGAVNAKMNCLAISNSRAADELHEADFVISAFTDDGLRKAEDMLLN
ncbi:MAG: HAD family phosphatase [Anaerolineaceae bacterium]|nr:HAD family phosphatase [Anaerolineaceae bacterium]